MIKRSFGSAAPVALGVSLASALAASAISYNPTTGHWYDLVTSGGDGSWASAEAAAMGLGGHLVTINDAAEEAWLRTTFSATDRYWIGYTDAATEGSWIWSSGETPGYANWGAGEPNDSTPPPEGEDYAVLNWNSDGSWNDWDHQRGDYYPILGIAEYERAGVPDGGQMLGLLGLGLVATSLAARRRA